MSNIKEIYETMITNIKADKLGIEKELENPFVRQRGQKVQSLLYCKELIKDLERECAYQ